MIDKIVEERIGTITEITDMIEEGTGLRRGNFRGNMRNCDRHNIRGENRNNYRNNRYDRSRNRPREPLTIIKIEVQATLGSRSGSRASTNRDRIRCYKYREYNHFMRDCPTSRDEKEIEQLQQMLNLGDE